MKIFILLIVSCLSVSAQWVNVRFWLHEPVDHEFRISGIPTNWPCAMMPTNAPVVISGWQLMAVEDFQNYKSARRAGYDAWVASRQVAAQNDRNAKLQELAGIFDRLELAQRNWSVLTQIQISEVVSNQNVLLLRLRPILRDLHKETVQ